MALTHCAQLRIFTQRDLVHSHASLLNNACPRSLMANIRGSVVGWGTHYATSREVAGSSPDEVIGFFNLLNPSRRTFALVSTQPLAEISTRNFPGGEGGRGVRLTTLPPYVSRLSRENVGASTSRNPMELHVLLQGYVYLYLFTYPSSIKVYLEECENLKSADLLFCVLLKGWHVSDPITRTSGRILAILHNHLHIAAMWLILLSSRCTRIRIDEYVFHAREESWQVFKDVV
jgi:hypothetical protein